MKKLSPQNTEADEEAKGRIPEDHYPTKNTASWSLHAQPKTERHDDEEQKEQQQHHEKRARRKRSLRRTRSQREESYQIPI